MHAIVAVLVVFLGTHSKINLKSLYHCLIQDFSCGARNMASSLTNSYDDKHYQQQTNQNDSSIDGGKVVVSSKSSNSSIR